jgi:signal transduction histidine kinase
MKSWIATGDTTMVRCASEAAGLLGIEPPAVLDSVEDLLARHPLVEPQLGLVDTRSPRTVDAEAIARVRRAAARATLLVFVREGDPSPDVLLDAGADEFVFVPCGAEALAARARVAVRRATRTRLDPRLLVADRMVAVGTLAAGVAHEVNNPLAAVTANLRFLSEELDAIADLLPASRRPDMLGALRDARDGAERVRVIVRDLKAFSRGDDECRGPVDVVRVLESTVQLAWNAIRHRARLVRKLDPVPDVSADEARLGQVFLNLILNAAEAIPDGDSERHEITIATREGGAGRVVAEVSDTGPGIPAGHLGRLFDPFFTTKPVGVGTGLGLFVCHGIITSMGGEITVESEPGRGTTFRVSLPIHVEAREEPPAPIAPSQGAPRGRILVVDDDALILVSVRRLLGGEHDVTAVESAREALRLVEDGERFGVILCDLMMPDMTGMDLSARLSHLAPDQAERMVFLTGGAFTPRARAFADENSGRCLDKPFEAQSLRQVVRELLR